MASITGILMYSWILLPLLSAGEVPPPCVLPFIYNNKSYSSCTGDASENKNLWCATTVNYDYNPQWKYCAHTEYGGNSGGQPCVFPFAYKSRTFYSCTSEDAEIGRFWCATTGSYDKDEKWSYCADTRLHANQAGSCVFPFIYKGNNYSSCTTDGASTGKLWCSHTSNYNVNPKWAYCDPSEPRPCHFPFIFKEKSYSACTKDGAGDGLLWCATTANYDTDSKWKACSHQEYEGNSKGQACVFPFIYKNRTFYTCSNEDTADGRFWCATTGNYDKDKKWSYCADIRQHGNNMGPCVFPFIYNGKSYSSCTTAGASTGKLWCSLTSNYDKDPKWTYCDPSEPRPCHFPFIFKGESYSSCTAEGSGDGLLWCATTADYDKDSKWRVCALQEYEGNSKGQACVFPFIYKNRTFYSCINEASNDGRFWCATTGSYDKDKKWSYCADTKKAGNDGEEYSSEEGEVLGQEKQGVEEQVSGCLSLGTATQEHGSVSRTQIPRLCQDPEHVCLLDHVKRIEGIASKIVKGHVNMWHNQMRFVKSLKQMREDLNELQSKFEEHISSALSSEDNL